MSFRPEEDHIGYSCCVTPLQPWIPRLTPSPPPQLSHNASGGLIGTYTCRQLPSVRPNLSSNHQHCAIEAAVLASIAPPHGVAQSVTAPAAESRETSGAVTMATGSLASVSMECGAGRVTGCSAVNNDLVVCVCALHRNAVPSGSIPPRAG